MVLGGVVEDVVETLVSGVAMVDVVALDVMVGK